MIEVNFDELMYFIFGLRKIFLDITFRLNTDRIKFNNFVNYFFQQVGAYAQTYESQIQKQQDGKDQGGSGDRRFDSVSI